MIRRHHHPYFNWVVALFVLPKLASLPGGDTLNPKPQTLKTPVNLRKPSCSLRRIRPVRDQSGELLLVCGKRFVAIRPTRPRGWTARMSAAGNWARVCRVTCENIDH